MKRILLLLLFISSLGFSQSSGITYQAVIYNPNGEELPGIDNPYAPLTNQDVCLQFGIVDADGNVEYQEEVQVTTDAFGMVNLLIGTNSQTGGYASDFTGVQWTADSKFLKVDLDIKGTCNDFEELSNQPFTYVPFAYYSPASDVPGPAGAQGPAGADGQDGAQGPQGEAGPQGATGANGTNGTDGQDGAQGLAGAQGSAGSAGPQGDTGEAGNDGADSTVPGPQGPQGIAGTDGQDGAQGPQGANGINGINGTNGTDGQAGAQGPQGEAGPQGDTGANGTNGTDGQDGAQGPQGLSGASSSSSISVIGYSPLNTTELTLTEAIEYCRDLLYDGFDDWRVPTFDEYMFMRQTLPTPTDFNTTTGYTNSNSYDKIWVIPKSNGVSTNLIIESLVTSWTVNLYNNPSNQCRCVR
ncbi:hypothetical protein OAD49_02680 [Flavobacteriaceae bacterium]|nr:hypothetical protein [Flavobacteriaceae bacterium]